jgi:hypothetical protein
MPNQFFFTPPMRRIFQNIVGFGAFIILMCFSTLSKAQYTENPLKDKRWVGFAGGLNTADNVSWNGTVFYTKRSDVILTTIRAGYSQEFIESAADTCTSMKNKIAEIGLMWGDGWGGNNWYLTGAAGFGFNVRRYCDDRDEGDVGLTAVTIGIPFQVELGAMLNPRLGVVLVAMGNWNLRQAYLGANIGVVWRLKKVKE